MDIQDMMEKAKSLSKMMGNEGNNEDSTNTLFENMFKMAGGFNKNNELSILKIENTNISSIKSVLPFLDEEYKEKMEQIIKMMEINNLIKGYKDTKISVERNKMKKQKLKKEAIMYIRPNLNNKNKSFVDTMMNAMEIGNIMTNIKK